MADEEARSALPPTARSLAPRLPCCGRLCVQLGRTLGEGAAGKVKFAVDAEDARRTAYAIKVSAVACQSGRFQIYLGVFSTHLLVLFMLKGRDDGRSY